MRNGRLTTVIIGVLLSGFIAEATFNLHQIQLIRERVAAIEAKVDLLLEDRHAGSR